MNNYSVILNLLIFKFNKQTRKIQTLLNKDDYDNYSTINESANSRNVSNQLNDLANQNLCQKKLISSEFNDSGQYLTSSLYFVDSDVDINIDSQSYHWVDLSYLIQTERYQSLSDYLLNCISTVVQPVEDLYKSLFSVLPESFTLKEAIDLLTLYNCISSEIDNSNFKRRFSRFIEQADSHLIKGRGRPSRLYKLKEDV